MKKINLVFLGSKEIGAHCLNTLINNDFFTNTNIKAVLTTKSERLMGSNMSVREIAQKHKITVLENMQDIEKLKDIDIIISVQYHKILKKEQIIKAKKIAINLHMAPLPEYRGCNQFSFAIIDRAKWFGTTIHKMTEGVDNGAIIFERRWKMKENTTVSELYKKTLTESKILFNNKIENILSENYKTINQSDLEKIRGKSFHTRKEINNIKQIDLKWSNEKIDRFIRATYFPPFSPPYTIINNKKILLTNNWRNEIK